MLCACSKHTFPISIHRGVQFRREFSQISEIRALTPPNTNLMALTATASLSTRKSITKTLEMTDCKVVARVPNNLNTRFALLPMPTSPQVILDPLIKELIQHGTKSERTIVFCRSYRVLLELYQYTILELNEHGALFADTPIPGKQSQFRVCDKYDACTSLEVRQNILKSFTEPEGNVRLIFATVAFAMGLDAPNVRRIIHWSPPDDIEMYIQESGRGGRDRKPSVAVLYYDEKNLHHANEDMKAYCSNKIVCRRVLLMSSFGSIASIKKPSPLHMCCDVCANACGCPQCCRAIFDPQQQDTSDENGACQTKDCSVSLQPPNPVSVEGIKETIILYRFNYAKHFSDPSAVLLAGLEIGTGISDYIINRVVEEAHNVSSESDLLKLGVPVEHGTAIFTIIKSQQRTE